MAATIAVIKALLSCVKIMLLLIRHAPETAGTAEIVDFPGSGRYRLGVGLPIADLHGQANEYSRKDV